MGCGAGSINQVSDSSLSLHSKLKRKIRFIRQVSVYKTIGDFISDKQLQIIDNSIQPLAEMLNNQELFKLQAGEPFILSQQRRIAWKLAIFQYNQFRPIPKHHTFTLTPIASNQQTKLRFYEISLDVKRTFPSVTQINRDHITSVLQNITLYFQGVGYTQGMNFYAGFLLLCGFTPKESFQIFVRLSFNKYFVIVRNFTQNFKNVNCSIKVMQQIIERSQNQALKQIKHKIQQLNLTLFLFVFSWFLTYFLYNFNLKGSLLIWDFIILHQPKNEVVEVRAETTQEKPPLFGNGFINTISLTLNIIQSLSDRLLVCQDIGQIMEILRHDAIDSYLDENKVRELIYKCRQKPSLDWPTFKNINQEFDSQLHSIIISLEEQNKPKDLSDPFSTFMDGCRFLKRSSKNLAATNFQ